MVTDPTKMKIAFNLQIPWDFKQFLSEKSERERISQNQLIVDALMQAYGNEFVMQQAKAPK